MSGATGVSWFVYYLHEEGNDYVGWGMHDVERHRIPSVLMFDRQKVLVRVHRLIGCFSCSHLDIHTMSLFGRPTFILGNTMSHSLSQSFLC